ncbi:hypothetical protein ACFXKG_40660 [Streptomyces sp. NPDC059255]|uniref:hypothetical protein n=1 Tax=Streptomyces sp. NPDC059255 TaxID=3346793 RepID=UPI003688DDD9
MTATAELIRRSRTCRWAGCAGTASSGAAGSRTARTRRAVLQRCSHALFADGGVGLNGHEGVVLLG